MNVATNLLGMQATVLNELEDFEYKGEICAVYVYDGLRVAIRTENGTVTDHIPASSLKLGVDNRYQVVVFVDDVHKIQIIAAIRSILNMGLRDAKDYYERSCRIVVFKKNVTMERAKDIVKLIEVHKLTPEILPMVDNEEEGDSEAAGAVS